MAGVETEQREIKVQVFKAINDRAEIIDRLSHIEGREDARTNVLTNRRRRASRRKLSNA